MTKLIVDCSTGEQRYEEETPEELAQMELDRQASATRDIMQAWISLRQERNRRLAACDWTQVGDAPLTEDQRAAYRTYRQMLRDLPAKVTDPQVVDWPVAPT